jgi:hypothetical protein
MIYSFVILSFPGFLHPVVPTSLATDFFVIRGEFAWNPARRCGGLR